MQYTFCAFQACESSIPLANNFVLDIVLGHLQEIAPPPPNTLNSLCPFISLQSQYQMTSIYKVTV